MSKELITPEEVLRKHTKGYLYSEKYITAAMREYATIAAEAAWDACENFATEEASYPYGPYGKRDGLYTAPNKQQFLDNMFKK